MTKTCKAFAIKLFIKNDKIIKITIFLLKRVCFNRSALPACRQRQDAPPLKQATMSTGGDAVHLHQTKRVNRNKMELTEGNNAG